MVATLSGSWMLSKALHPLNAYWLMVTMVLGSVMFSKAVQPWNV